MKIHVLLATLVLGASSVFAQQAPAIYPLPATLPAAPEGVNPAAYPLPRVDWLQRVKSNFSKADPLREKIQLVFDGDSITDGWQGAGKTIWAARYAKLNAFDFGIGGDRTESVLWRLSQGQMDGINPKLIALMIGTNNLGGYKNEQIVEGIKTTVAEYQKRCPKAVILLQAIFPRGEHPTDPYRARIKEINAAISAFGDGKKVIFVDFGDKFLNPDGTMSREIMNDFLHPTAKGYQIWAEAIAPVIAQFFPESAQASQP